MADTVYDFEVESLSGKKRSMKEHAGKVLLIVNTASQCGYTPQLGGLEKLFAQYREGGFEVLGFPCNQFGHQEPGTAKDIEQVCQVNYGVTFPMHAKIEVNGGDAHPLYKHLKHAAPGLLGTEAIKWNFTKFLVDRKGQVVRRYAPGDTPEAIAKDIEAQLGAPA